MTDLPDAREQRLAELRKEVTRRGFDWHASLLQNVSEMPGEFQSAAVTALAARETIQTIILFPPQIQRGWEYVPRQALLFTATGLIHLLASIWPGEPPQITRLEACGLLYMKVTLILLYGFLEIVAQGPEAPIQVGLEFNTVNWHRLSPPLRRFLQGTLPEGPADNDRCSSAAQQTLNELPLKFLNGIRIYGLLPGEELKGLVFQPGTWKRWLYFFRQPASANTLLLLTSHYLVVIQEELNVKQGWIVSYIPRASITGIQNRPCGPWSELAVQLRQGNQSATYKVMLKNEAAETWREQWLQKGGVWERLPEEQP
jgi:hypothetical protein